MATVQVHPISFTSPKRASVEFCDCYLIAGLQLYLFFNQTEELHQHGVYCVKSIVCGFSLQHLEVQCAVMQISMDICGSV